MVLLELNSGKVTAAIPVAIKREGRRVGARQLVLFAVSGRGLVDAFKCSSAGVMSGY